MMEDEAQDQITSIKGDSIGGTAYSEKYVIKVLMKLVKIKELCEDDIETLSQDLCVLWDMTTEEDVCQFLILHNIFAISCITLNDSNNMRIIEIVIGIMANIYSHQEIKDTFHSKESTTKMVCKFINSEESMVVIQVLRYINANIYYNSEDLLLWMNFFQEHDIISSLTHILKNSLNNDVLINCIQLINSICAYLESESEKDAFKNLFINKLFSSAIVEGFREILKVCKDNALDKTSEEFLFITSTIINLEEEPCVFNGLKEDLVEISVAIVSNAIKIDSEYIVDIVQYVTSLLVVVNSCDVEHIKSLCLVMLTAWNHTLHLTHFSKVKKIMLMNALPHYFVRIVIQHPTDMLNTIFHNTNKDETETLIQRIKSMLCNNEIDPYFSKVPELLENVIS